LSCSWRRAGKERINEIIALIEREEKRGRLMLQTVKDACQFDAAGINAAIDARTETGREPRVAHRS
jgi:hypothetical protein